VLPPDDLAAPMSPRFLLWLAERLGSSPGALDLVLAAPAELGPPPLALERATVEHPRVTRAQRLRRNVTVYSDRSGGGLLAVGQGLAGRWELAFEVAPPFRGRGLGRALARAARHVVPPGEPVFAQVATGNAMSLRAILAAGYRPIGSEVLFYRRDLTPGPSPQGEGS
jgi:GNAT superfamily N-acetyltransferase